MFKDTRGCVLTTNNHQAYEIFLKGLEKYLSLDETGIPEFEQSILYDNEFSTFKRPFRANALGKSKPSCTVML